MKPHALSLCLVMACSHSVKKPPQQSPGHEPATATSAARVVATQQSKLGLVTVEERYGLRLLLHQGVVQGAMRIGQPRGPRLTSRLPRLLRAMRPTAKRALVIGLGTGITASRLTEAGYDVLAVAHDRVLIDVARRHFGFRGRVATATGLDQLKQIKGRFDVVVWDVRALPGPTPIPVESVDVVRNTLLAESGVLVVRIKASPKNPALERLAERIGQTYTHWFGTGIGDELQNLYVFHSAKPINVASLDAANTLWPVTLPKDRTQTVADEERSGPREVLLVGYLTREPSSQALAVDLPRWERGAVRYLLAGEETRTLARRMPATKQHSPQRESARGVLGGGGAPRSDVQFSPVVVAVRGSPRVVSVVHWDAAEDSPDSRRRQTVTDPRLPYGGALYELTVTEVIGVYDRSAWHGAQKRLLPLVGAAVHAIDKEQFLEAAAALGHCVASLMESFGPVVAPRVQMFDEIHRIKQALDAEAARAKNEAGPLLAGQSCDRTAIAAGYHYTRANSLARKLADALGSCAERNYERVIAGKSNGRTWAASRLVQLFEDRMTSLPAASADRLRQKISQLKAEFGDRLRDVDAPSANP